MKRFKLELAFFDENQKKPSQKFTLENQSTKVLLRVAKEGQEPFELVLPASISLVETMRSAEKIFASHDPEMIARIVKKLTALLTLAE